jgi:hypothetical protein
VQPVCSRAVCRRRVQTPGTLPLAYRLLYRCAVRTALGEKPKARLDRAEIPRRKGFLVDHPFFILRLCLVHESFSLTLITSIFPQMHGVLNVHQLHACRHRL